MTDQNVGLVRVGFFSFLGDEKELVEQEESAFVFGSLQTKSALEDQLSVSDQIRAFPVGQQALDFLRGTKKTLGFYPDKCVVFYFNMQNVSCNIKEQTLHSIK